MSTETDIAVMKEHMANMDEKMDRVVNVLCGSGDDPGVVVRMDRLERTDERRTWLIRTIVGVLCVIGLEGFASRFGW